VSVGFPVCLQVFGGLEEKIQPFEKSPFANYVHQKREG
jgi:hypothetical protein